LTGDTGSGWDEEFSEGVSEWMRSHTIGDLKTMVSDFERRGESTCELRALISELTRMAEETGLIDYEGGLSDEQVPA